MNFFFGLIFDWQIKSLNDNSNGKACIVVSEDHFIHTFKVQIHTVNGALGIWLFLVFVSHVVSSILLNGKIFYAAFVIDFVFSFNLFIYLFILILIYDIY